MIGAGLSDRGQIRELNEDHFTYFENLNGYAFAIVADGMGGHQAGEIASSMACAYISEMMKESVLQPDVDIAEKLYEAIEQANQKIYDYASHNPALIGMGTTIVVVIATNESFVVAHVGDSRLYLQQEQDLRQLTLDHSHVQSLIDQGIITAEEARSHPKKNIILRALGTEQEVQIDVSSHSWQSGDRLLLCSDGLTNMLNDEQLHGLLCGQFPLESIVSQLITAANDAGGDDNITAVVLQNHASTFSA